jgi:hypothetical protein
VGWLNKLWRQMKTTTSHVDSTTPQSYYRRSISTLVVSTTLVMRGLPSRLGGLPRKKSSQKKRPTLVVLVIDGSLVLWPSSACTQPIHGRSKPMFLFGTLVHFLKAVPEGQGSQ